MIKLVKIGETFLYHTYEYSEYNVILSTEKKALMSYDMIVMKERYLPAENPKILAYISIGSKIVFMIRKEL